MIFTTEHTPLSGTAIPFMQRQNHPHVAAGERAGEFRRHALFKNLGDRGLRGLTYAQAIGSAVRDFCYSRALIKAAALFSHATPGADGVAGATARVQERKPLWALA